MDYSNSQKRRMRPEDDRGPLPSQIPRPYNKSSSKTPIQLSAPPRAHQYHRPGPANPYTRQPSPGRHDRSVNGSESSFNIPPPPIPQSHNYSSRQAPDHQPPSRSQQVSARHLSHISAMSVSQPDTDSRPVSGAFVVSPALPSAAVSEVGEEEEYNARSASHSRATSQGRRTKTTTPNRSRKNSIPIRDSETLPASDQSATMEALTAAIRQGLNPTAASSRSLTPKPFSEAPGLRMPFQAEEPSSPSSVYTDVTAAKRFSAPLSSYQGYDHRDTPSTLVEQEASEYDKSQYGQDLPTPMSTHPIIAGAGPGMSSKIPPGKRPLRLDISAVRDAEARGSMTSLSDLIKRATRLASNLDRGKTASRLGHLDMFGSTDRLGNMRNSTYSDVLDAFPPPAHGTSTPNNGRPNTLWPNGDKQFMTSKSSLGRFMDTNEKTETGEKPRRKCCGLSPVIFVLLLIAIVLLIAAAVLVPVFLLVLPKQHHSVDLSTCHTTHSCQNGGYSVSANDVCSCVCVDGFTGNDCSTERDPECVTAALSDGGSNYDNATIGSSILPLLQNAQTSFNIPLNTTKLLSRFAYNNLSCVSENSLVEFATHSTRVKRFVIIPGMMSTEPHVPVLNLPPSESKQHPRFVIVEGLPDTAEELPLLPTKVLNPRQDATQSANGIVFATSSDTASSPTATATGTSTTTGSASPSTSSQTSKLNATDNQLDFAATVVLFVLQTSAQINDAVTANQMILAHFQETSPANSTVIVKDGKDGMQADFENFQIKFSNGTTVGGNGSVKDGT